MRVSQTYSHLNAEEYLRIRQPELYQEVLSLVSKCRTKHSAPFKMSSSGMAMKQIGRNFRKLARQLGWSETRTGLKKRRIAIKLYHAPYPTRCAFEEILGSRLIDYTNCKIDVAIEIFPAETGGVTEVFEPGSPREVRGFAQAKEMVGRFGRHTPPVPVLIIGIA